MRPPQLGLFHEGRTRLSHATYNLAAEELPLHMPGSPNTVGWLLHHIAEWELLFATHLFPRPTAAVALKRHLNKPHIEHLHDLQLTLHRLNDSGQALENAILNTPEVAWETAVVTEEFGSQQLAAYLGRILTHTAYHAGQVMMIRKYAPRR